MSITHNSYHKAYLMKGPGAAVQVDEGAGRVRAKGDRGVRDAEERGDREGRP